MQKQIVGAQKKLEIENKLIRPVFSSDIAQCPLNFNARKTLL